MPLFFLLFQLNLPAINQNFLEKACQIVRRGEHFFSRKPVNVSLLFAFFNESCH